MSQTGVWTGLQPQGCGDTERFNSSSVAKSDKRWQRIFFFCDCACWESNPGHKHGRLVCCHYTTCAYAARQSKGPNFQRLMLHFASGAQRSSSPTGKLTHPDDTLAEWLRRRPAKPMGSPCVGSNPTGVVLISHPLAAREGGFFSADPNKSSNATRGSLGGTTPHGPNFLHAPNAHQDGARQLLAHRCA